jgi:hypothetical protein
MGERRQAGAGPPPVLVGAASGLILLVFFTVVDRFSFLAVAAVLAYWTLFAGTYLILGKPGRDWQLPVDATDITMAVRRTAGILITSARTTARTTARAAGPPLRHVGEAAASIWPTLGPRHRRSTSGRHGASAGRVLPPV